MSPATVRPADADAWPAGDDWRGRFGDACARAAYRSLFTEWIAVEGAADVLAQTLPQLMPGCSAGGFDSLIGVADALQAGDAAGLADSLAAWCCGHLLLGPLPARVGRQLDPLPLLRRLRAGTSQRPLLHQRLQDAAASKQLQQAVASLAIDAQTLARLMQLSAVAHAGSGQAMALQLLRACHAMQGLLPHIDAPAPALRWFWQAWATVVVAAALRRLPQVPNHVERQDTP